jgi:hypothetical protein
VTATLSHRLSRVKAACRRVLATSLDPVVGVVRRVRTRTPQPERSCSCPLRQRLQPVRVSPPAAVVEVRRGGPDRDEPDVHAVARPDDVAEETAVLIDAVGRGFRR